MNIKKITNKLSLWKDIENFYSFDELIYLSNQYYEGIRILFATNDCIFDFNFFGTELVNPLTNKNNIRLEVTYNELLFAKNNINSPNYINYDSFFFKNKYIFYKQNFKNQFKNKILNSVQEDYPIKKFCLLSELYQNILDDINI